MGIDSFIWAKASVVRKTRIKNLPHHNYLRRFAGFLSSPKGTKLIAVGNAHGNRTENISDPERVEHSLTLSGSSQITALTPWALPTAIEFHACGVTA
jgi:hypothetical protein